MPSRGKLVEVTPTKSLATPTGNESEVISEVLDHTPSESVPEEVSEATPTNSRRSADYSNDSFEGSSAVNDHTHSHSSLITASPAAEQESISGGNHTHTHTHTHTHIHINTCT